MTGRFTGGLDLGVFAGLETDTPPWHEDGLALAAVLFCRKGMGWVPFSKPWHVGASDGRNPCSLPISDSWALGTLPLVPPASPGYMVAAVIGAVDSSSTHLFLCPAPLPADRQQVHTTDVNSS